jgi:glycerophosphoryl diester phosphodiesterase
LHVQHPENTIGALRHGIKMFDGIELDVRLTVDDGLILHHDRELMASKKYHDPNKKFVEEYSLDELTGIGFTSFEQLLNDPVIHNHWKNHNKMVCIEIKRPHPRAPNGGGFNGKKHHIEHVSDCIKKIDEMLDEFQIPSSSTMYYSFHKHMKQSIQRSSTSRRWASLIPYIVPYGSRRFQRLKAFPTYLTTSFSRLLRQHQAQGASILPCAIEYLKPSTNWIPLGRKVGLKGKSMQRLNHIRQGMPMYVWPVKPIHEASVISAGLSALTDVSDPTKSWLPSNNPRWLNPATQPLLEEEQRLLQNSTFENHEIVLSDLKENIPIWSQSEESRKVNLINEWCSKWSVSSRYKTEALESMEDDVPIFAPRLIGHRGSGKTSRPVID